MPSPTDIEGIVALHAARVRNPFNACKTVSHRLAEALCQAGHDASVLRCSGLQDYAPDADARWQKLGKQLYWIHYVVAVEDRTYDLTRRQFVPGSPRPHVLTRAQLDAQWLEVGRCPDWTERHAPTAPPRP